jgi:hypothetical protein
MKRKLNLGKKTMNSVEIQVASILQSIHSEHITVESIEPVRYDHGIYFRVFYHIVNEPAERRSKYFAHQKTRDCCDVWLESPMDFNRAFGENAA